MTKKKPNQIERIVEILSSSYDERGKNPLQTRRNLCVANEIIDLIETARKEGYKEGYREEWVFVRKMAKGLWTDREAETIRQEAIHSILTSVMEEIKQGAEKIDPNFKKENPIKIIEKASNGMGFLEAKAEDIAIIQKYLNK